MWTASVQTGATDIGQGSGTVISQIVAEVLGLRMQDITINSGVDTDFTPLDPGTYGSRVSLFSGNAAKLAAEDAKRQLAEVAGELLGVAPEAACLQKSKGVSRKRSGKSIEDRRAYQECRTKIRHSEQNLISASIFNAFS